MPRPRKACLCFACGTFESRGWRLNYDKDDNVLCEKCNNYYIRRPPKKLTIAYRAGIQERHCVVCGSNDPNPNGNHKGWSQYKGHTEQFLCVKCYAKEYLHKRNNPRRFAFKNKIIFEQSNPRIGVCNLCRAIVGEIDAQCDKLCRRSGLHHEVYDSSNPKANTIEVCNRCHAVITGTSKRLKLGMLSK